MTATNDVFVIGLGGMGSAAAYHLAKRGQRVIGFDAHAPGHAFGSSHGTSRIIRQSIYEAPEYVPLVMRAYALWRELEAATDRQLLTITGRLLMGAPDSRTVRGMLLSAKTHGLPHDYLAAAEVRARFPGFNPTDDMVGVYEPDAGMLAPEACITAHLTMAARHGAELRHAEPVLNWAADGAGVRVETKAGVVRAGRLVITAGAWAPALLAELNLPLAVTRQTIVHFASRQPERFSVPNCPVFGFQVPEGQYYGTPAVGAVGFKIGRHNAGEPCSPDSVQRQLADAEIDHYRQVADKYLPGSAGACQLGVVCLYTHTPDGHFIVDRHPAHPQIAYASACSGHGYKYCAVIGEILADLAIDGATSHPTGFIAARRFPSAAA